MLLFRKPIGHYFQFICIHSLKFKETVSTISAFCHLHQTLAFNELKFQVLRIWTEFSTIAHICFISSSFWFLILTSGNMLFWPDIRLKTPSKRAYINSTEAGTQVALLGTPRIKTSLFWHLKMLNPSSPQHHPEHQKPMKIRPKVKVWDTCLLPWLLL